MSVSTRDYIEERSIGRRNEDRLVRDRIRKYDQIFKVGQIITSEVNLDTLFEVIMTETNQILGTRRSTVFLHDKKAGELWSLVATGMKRNEIRIPDNYGVAGWVFTRMKPLMINDAYNDPRFYSEVDKKSGFRTRNIFCVPLMNRQGECIGALQALNKVSGRFTDRDRDLLSSISCYVAIALENAKLYEELKALDRARERVINHLSHELKTPIAIISSALARISREIRKENVVRLEKAVERCGRNLQRLMDLQEKIDDILNRKPVEEGEKIIRLIRDAADFVEEAEEDGARPEGVDRIIRRIHSLFSTDEIRMEEIPLDRFLGDLCDEALSAMGAREMEIVRDFGKGIRLRMDRGVLTKVCGGLLQNAVENTPDEGRVSVTAGSDADGIRITFQDFGIGITPENQKMIFGGFFHTQDTEAYSSGRPYGFNAGGAGADLLRTKCLSQRFGFSVSFESSRCRFLPEDSDLCPGRVSACPSIENQAECFASGGSIFRLFFPQNGSAG